MKRPRVLVIDDDSNLRRTLSDILNARGYETFVAAEGCEGLAFLEDNPVHLVLIDLGLPDMSGMEVLARIKADHPSTDAIILTGQATLDSAMEATNRGAFSYLVKPYEMDQLMLHIRRVLEKQQADEALRESETKHRFIFENAIEGIFQTTPDGRFIFANPAQAKLLGYNSPLELMEQATDIPRQHYANLEDREACRNILEKNGVIKEFETQLLKKDGSPVWVSISAQVIRDSEGGVIYQGTAMDITERRRMENALQNSEEKHRLLFDSAGDAIFIVDAKARILAANPLACKQLGYSHAELTSMTIDQIDSPAEARKVPGRLTRLMEHGHSKFETVQRRKDGSLVPTEANAQRIVWDGRPAIMSICRDITERKRVEEELRESEERLRLERDRLELILETAQDGFWLVDALTGNLLDVNEAASSMLGYKREELLARGLVDIDVNWAPEEIRRLMQEVRAAGNAFFETRQRTKDGRIINVEVSVTYLPATEQFFSFVRNITDRKKTEEAILNEKNKFLTLSENAPFGVVLVDKEGNFIYINLRFKELFGYDIEDVPDGRTWFRKAYPDPEYRKTVISAWVDDLNRAKAGQKRPRIFRVQCKDGTEKIVNFIPVQLETGEHMMSCDDITEQKRLEQQLHAISLTDELTGLYNRRGFITLSGQQLKIAERTKKGLLLFFADLDKMKYINDTLGHQAGDTALVEVAAILKEVFRESDIIGRMGGDEFAVLAIDTADEARKVLMERLYNTIDHYNRQEGRKYQLSLSIGTACYDPETPLTLDGLMIQADKLMYGEKRNKQHHETVRRGRKS